MPKTIRTWEYRGPIYIFDLLTVPNAVYRTRAVSLRKAKVNIMYQVKKALGRTVNSKVFLPGTFTEVESEKYTQDSSIQLRMDI